MNERLILRRSPPEPDANGSANASKIMAQKLKRAGIEVLDVTENMILVEGDQSQTAKVARNAEGWTMYQYSAAVPKPTPVAPMVKHRRKLK